MGNIFKKPTIQVPAPQAAPDPTPTPEVPLTPTIDDAARNQDTADRIRKRRGRLSTILVPNQAAPTGGAAKQLLGQGA